MDPADAHIPSNDVERRFERLVENLPGIAA